MKRLIPTSSSSARYPPLVTIFIIFWVCIILEFFYANTSFLSNTKKSSTIYILLHLAFCTNNISQRYFQINKDLFITFIVLLLLYSIPLYAQP